VIDFFCATKKDEYRYNDEVSDTTMLPVAASLFGQKDKNGRKDFEIRK
jgi:hypothetical protein